MPYRDGSDVWGTVIHRRGARKAFLMIMLVRVGVLAAGFIASGAVASEAEELGYVDAGFKFAGERCAECHDITSRNPMTTGSGIPTFATVANTPGMTRTSLVVWMQTSHPEMPNLILEPQDLDNVIAYILSLRTK